MKVLVGKVISAKREKTLKVSVERTVFHTKYKKYYKRDTIYNVHDPKSLFQEQDKVQFVLCRPISKTKHSIVLYKS